MIRTLFMGTPEFAVPSLSALHDHPDFDVIGIVTQPDRPAGRGQVIHQSAVKLFALKQGLSILQPPSLRESEIIAAIKRLNPNVIVVAAFGQILRQSILEIPQYGCINVHASLLPRWRGAAPIQYAIRAGDTETGITIMKMDIGLDTGPILKSMKVAIDPSDTGETLHDKLAIKGGDMLTVVVREFISGFIVPQPQPEEGITYAPTLHKEEGLIHWQSSATDIDRQVRAFTPWPGCYTVVEQHILKIIKGHYEEAMNFGDEPPGTVISVYKNPAVRTGEGVYVLDEVQPAGKTKMTGQAYLAGHPNFLSSVLNSAEG